MTGFSLRHSESAASDPAVVNFDAPLAGNLLLAVVSERSGTGSTTHAVTDANGNTWAKLLGHDQELANGSARHSLSIWRHIATATDALGAFNVSADDGTANTKRLSIFEIDPDAAYDFTFEEESSADSGTGSTSPLSSGTSADPGGSDLFVVGIAGWRVSSGEGGVTSPAFTNLDSTDTLIDGGDNGLSHALAFTTSGAASGGKETTVSWSGAGAEALCAVLVFSSEGGGDPPAAAPVTLMLMGIGT